MCTNGSLELFPPTPAPAGGDQGLESAEVKGMDSKARQTGFRSQLWC